MTVYSGVEVVVGLQPLVAGAPVTQDGAIGAACRARDPSLGIGTALSLQEQSAPGMQHHSSSTGQATRV